MAATSESEPMVSELKDVRVEGKEKENLPFFRENLDPYLPSETKDMLETYSKIPREQQSEHIHKIRDMAWNLRAWPCIGLGTWLTPQLRRQSFYPEILERVNAGAVLMDIGTFIGHDIRRLVYEGAPSKNLYGVDIANHFETGYECFQDRDTFKGHFIEADFLNPDASPELAALKNSKVDIIVISQVLHQWSLAHQLTAAKALVEFTKPGTWIVGNQIGHPIAQEGTTSGISSRIYSHNPETFAKMWDDAGAATGTKWETEAKTRAFGSFGFDEKDMDFLKTGHIVLEFRVKRLE
ncbi:hypothetical protein F5Y16DRAFT_389050 [Xylariaceae sp. FL0255]|nr:hypothetical protein F5Y16DRAFT_389050 [Xylariaceae sp. FL0255]